MDWKERIFRITGKIIRFLYKFLFRKVILYFLIVYTILFILYRRLSKESFFQKAEKPIGYLFKPITFATKPFFRNTDESETNTEPIGVKSVRVITEAISPSISSSGSIEFREKVEIFSKVSGRIEKFYVREGDQVSKGQKLFKIESMPYELEMMKQLSSTDSAKSQLNLAKEKYFKAKRSIEIRLKESEKAFAFLKKAQEELNRSKDSFKGKNEIFEENGITREEVEMARVEVIAKEAAFTMAKRDVEISQVGLRDEDIKEAGFPIPKDREERIRLLKQINTKIEKAEVEVAESILKGHESQLETTKIMLKEAILYSPIEGIVAKKYKSAGEAVTSGTLNNQSIMTLVDVDDIFVVFNVNETESSNLRKNMGVKFTLDAFPDQKYEGKIQFISPMVDQKSHTVEVKAIAKNPKLTLKPGMFVRANTVIGDPEPVNLIPSSAIIPREEGNADLFVIKKNKIFKAEVKLGKKFGEKTAVKEGLKEGDVVAIEKISQLREGMDVLPLLQD